MKKESIFDKKTGGYMTAKLSKQLKELRKLKGFSLREVEERTKISNAYISQLERGDAKNPSPHKLHKLAELYEVPYESLMDAAGYIVKSNANKSMTNVDINRIQKNLSAVGAALMSEKFTEDEEIAISAFIHALRAGKKDK